MSLFKEDRLTRCLIGAMVVFWTMLLLSGCEEEKSIALQGKYGSSFNESRRALGLIDLPKSFSFYVGENEYRVRLKEDKNCFVEKEIRLDTGYVGKNNTKIITNTYEESDVYYSQKALTQNEILAWEKRWGCLGGSSAVDRTSIRIVYSESDDTCKYYVSLISTEKNCLATKTDRVSHAEVLSADGIRYLNLLKSGDEICAKDLISANNRCEYDKIRAESLKVRKENVFCYMTYGATNRVGYFMYPSTEFINSAKGKVIYPIELLKNDWENLRQKKDVSLNEILESQAQFITPHG